MPCDVSLRNMVHAAKTATATRHPGILFAVALVFNDPPSNRIEDIEQLLLFTVLKLQPRSSFGPLRWQISST